MKVVLGSDQDGMRLKEVVKDYLLANGFDVLDQSEEASADFVESTNAVVDAIKEDEEARGILFDAYGAGSFIAATKHQGIIAAEVSEERSAYMTREHNNAKIITLGAWTVGEELARNIVREFLAANYDAGRHQIRVDMLNAMC